MSEARIVISMNVLKDCLGLGSGELLAVVADDDKRELAESVYEAGKRLGAESMLLIMQPRSRSGEEPPAPVAEAMAKADVAVCITTHSMTHTAARKQAAAAGTRVATMPGMTDDMFSHGAITADYGQVKELTEQVAGLLSAGREVRVEKEGLSLSFSIDGRDGVLSTGLYLNPGESGNLPSGEAYIAPLEGTAAGQIKVDGSIAGIGALNSPLVLTVEQGRLTAAEGDGGDKLLEMLGAGDGRLLGEFGIGTNNKARITGVVLEDEKVYGTIHVAFGSNNTFGGTVAAGVHIDAVVMKPDVYIDGKLIMRAGELL
ncbi:aminopeptidase [Paenibacillus sp. FSL R7-0273]|uniref:aminopeptidase n=1 Tax=Paenibacillus sp. FSL R7-0273 TaxID=1536772 RepID=UPI0004F77653|nr:aminopeptidase [Paenibacillus sp. FSL R7-0273]AIQ48283.1 aminopeptidase [Paenibacillus sp. FSL R7-0273]OMF86935.1 aminopeptidase [Paenibacillus sp. FSL R7-0273]